MIICVFKKIAPRSRSLHCQPNKFVFAKFAFFQYFIESKIMLVHCKYLYLFILCTEVCILFYF